MGIEIFMGMIMGILFILFGYIVQKKKTFSFLAGFGDTWEPINKNKLGNRIGILLMILGIIAILTSVFSIWFGSAVGKVSVTLAVIDVILIIVSIGLDRLGY